ncbi:putative cation-transporting ATPase 13A2 [Smittium mucronatum]|uniref:Putative cation-transporting ATPase 13A2 n=1 Tax=Smittium mucronatum TaxID=133383 RepID=A0A1R0H573_9FUNG|nr:putative cation-transporting ATPase 13A2 [Smittium mucronatum]
MTENILSFKAPDIFFIQSFNLINQSCGGLSQQEAEYRNELLGPNFISVKVPTFLQSCGKEFSGFFYIYQFMILLLFYYYSYYQIDGKFVPENTKNLVVGDLVAIELGQIISFDGVLVSGEIIVDESSLTGEAMPIRKIKLPPDTEYYDGRNTSKINSVLAGTKVLQVNSESSPFFAQEKNYPNCIVTKIGTCTEKGLMIKKILNPSKIMFIFDKQIRVVMLILFVQGVVWMGFAFWLLNASAIAGFFSGIFSLAQLISPLLPASLVIGQSIAVQRLKKKNIYCIDIPRVLVAGKIQIFCFDKTGTLTKEGLEFDRVVESVSTPDRPQEIIKSQIIENDNDNDNLLLDPNSRTKIVAENTLMGLGCCHSVSKLGESFIGNPVDIEMFNNSGYAIGETKEGFIQSFYKTEPLQNIDSPPKIHILKRNDFIHHRMSMSVMVLEEESMDIKVFVKGSFEKIFELCNKSTIPVNYYQTANRLAREGNYVLGLASKNYGKVDRGSVLNLEQDEVESDLTFSCLIVFRNNLKFDTKDALAQIKSSNTRVVMITGDTTLTGVFIARECGMIEQGVPVAIADLDINGNVEFSDIDTDEKVFFNNDDKSASIDNYELAVTSEAYEKMISTGEIKSLIPYIRVFGRMTPQNKVSCINYHMELGITAMCGDGGNDCGALREAHVGIALSDSEASIVSPFSSSNKSIFSCVDLMSQTRGALATSFSNYKYLILYGQTMASFKVLNIYIHGEADRKPIKAKTHSQDTGYTDRSIFVGADSHQLDL